MFQSLLLLAHPIFGVLVVLSALWLLVELLNVHQQNIMRIHIAAIILPVCLWVTYILAGFWYVKFYGADKTFINAGPFSLADSFFMEVKEHIFFSLLLLGSYIPFIIFTHNLIENKAAQKLGLWIAGCIILLGLSMEGLGAIVSIGVKTGLLSIVSP